MPRIETVSDTNIAPETRQMLEQVNKSLGVTPNIMATMGHSPATLKAYLGFGQALGTGSLSSSIREQIALAIAGENACGYCAAAHTQLAARAGVSQEEADRNLRGTSDDPRVQAALDFAREIVARRGWVEDEHVEAVRRAGFSDGEITEIIATVAINIFTNYLNHVAGTEIDFPEVELPQPVAS